MRVRGTAVEKDRHTTNEKCFCRARDTRGARAFPPALFRQLQHAPRVALLRAADALQKLVQSLQLTQPGLHLDKGWGCGGRDRQGDVQRKRAGGAEEGEGDTIREMEAGGGGGGVITYVGGHTCAWTCSKECVMSTKPFGR